ncbi:hypothetical protein D3C86_2089990 [compost metagenome]
MQMRYALWMVHRQTVFQEILDGTRNSRFVAEAFLPEIQGNVVAQFGNAFPLIHFRLL